MESLRRKTKHGSFPPQIPFGHGHSFARRIFAVFSAFVLSSSWLNADFGDLLLELDFRGTSVAVSDQFVLVGSPFRRSVSVFEIASGNSLGDLKLEGDSARIGGTIAIDESIALISGEDADAAYLFDVTNGELLHKLVPDDPRSEQKFGRSLALDDGIALVGAPGDDEKQDRGGAVYAFDVQTGTQLHKIVPDISFPRSGLVPLFGSSMALDDGVAVISEANSEVLDGRFAVGGAYAFDVESGRQLRKFRNPERPDTHDFFGASVDIDSGRVIIGVSGTDDACPETTSACLSGAAYVFDLESGDLQQKLTLADGKRYDHFGAASVLEGDVAIIAGLNDAENAYFFDVQSGNELMRIPSGDVFAASHGKGVVVGRRSTQVFDIAVVPEPSSFHLFIFGILTLHRRRNLGVFRA